MKRVCKVGDSVRDIEEGRSLAEVAGESFSGWWLDFFVCVCVCVCVCAFFGTLPPINLSAVGGYLVSTWDFLSGAMLVGERIYISGLI